MNKGLFALYAMVLVNLLLMSHMHGKIKEGRYDFWTSLLGNIITLILVWWAIGWKFI